MIDLRSDTITQPTPNMRQAMLNAEVGDDVFGDDPTVNQLETRVAKLLGKEEAVFMPSGTMTNQVALRVHTEPGDELIIEQQAHIYYYEAGAPAALSGLMPRLIAGKRGLFTSDDLLQVIRPADIHFPHTKLVCLENTHNRGGGSVWPIDQLAEVAKTARKLNLKMHLDGARLWNACAATGISERDYAQHFDTVSVCFSKGLGAPIGSALAGSSKDMQRARRFRKQFGGGMRQAGILAAAVLYALDHHRQRLVDDHTNAKRLAEGLAEIDHIHIDPATVQTNIVLFDVDSIEAVQLQSQLNEMGVWVLVTGQQSIRAVMNLHVTEEDVVTTINTITQAMKTLC